MPTSGSGSASGVVSSTTYADWPTVEEVTLRVEGMGLTAPDEDTISQAREAAIGAWEKATNYEPFLGTGTDETRYLTADTCLIDFGGGITANPTSLTINGNYDDDGDYENGTALVRNRDYILMPQNALAKGLPFTYCKLVRYHALGREGAVKIVAPFGYAETVPALAWEAVMKEILLRLTPQLMIAESGGFDSIKQGPVEWRNQMAGGSFKVSHEMMSSEAKSAAAGYRRLTVA